MGRASTHDLCATARLLGDKLPFDAHSFFHLPPQRHDRRSALCNVAPRQSLQVYPPPGAEREFAHIGVDEPRLYARMVFAKKKKNTRNAGRGLRTFIGYDYRFLQRNGRGTSRDIELDGSRRVRLCLYVYVLGTPGNACRQKVCGRRPSRSEEAPFG